MFVLLHKLNEDAETVLYKFETNIWESLQEIDQRGHPKQILKTVWGISSFNKITGEFVLDTKKTDLYFLSKRNREAEEIHALLLRFKEQNKYPELYEIASG